VLFCFLFIFIKDAVVGHKKWKVNVIYSVSYAILSGLDVGLFQLVSDEIYQIIGIAADCLKHMQVGFQWSIMMDWWCDTLFGRNL